MQSQSKGPIFQVLEPILGIFAFFITLTFVAYGISLAPINAGSISVLVVEKTSIGINILGFLALLVGVLWTIAIVRGKNRGLIVRKWAIIVGMLVAFALLRLTAKVHGGEMDTAGPAQLTAMSVAFVGFWLGFYGKEENLVGQAMLVFGTLTMIYWCLDLTAMPSVISSGAPFTSFAGGGLADSDFVYPFSAAIGYVVAKVALKALRFGLQKLDSAILARQSRRGVL